MPIFAKVNPALFTHDKVVGLPSDSARWAYLRAIGFAKLRDSHVFTRAALTESLGSYSRHIPTLVRAKLIDQEGSNYVIHDYEEHQSSDRYDPTAVRRNREYRARKRAEPPSFPPVDTSVDNVTEAVTRDVTRDVSDASRAHGARVEKSREVVPDKHGTHPRANGGISDELPDDESELTALVDTLVMAGVWTKPTRKMIGFLANLIRDHGQKLVEEQIAVILKRRSPIPEDFMGELAGLLRQTAVARTVNTERARVESNRRAIEAEQEQIEQRRKQPGAEAVAAERRSAIAALADALGSPPTARPRRSQQEGRQPT